MEGAEDVVVAPVDPGWSDVGGWAALHELGEKDAAGNVVIGQVLSIDAEGNYLRVDAGKRLAVVGISGLVVVAHGNDIVIVPRDRAQDVTKRSEDRRVGKEGVSTCSSQWSQYR